MKNYCNELVKQGQEAKEELVKRMQDCPLFAMEWAEKYLMAIASGELASSILGAIKEGQTEEKLLEYIKNSILSEAKYLNRSTSILSNYIKDLEKQAKAIFIDNFKYR